MDELQQLGAMDGAFLHLETAQMPMHVGSLHRYQLPEGHRGNWAAKVRTHLAKRLHLSPVFTRKLAPMPLDLANPVWIEDDDIDIDYHVRLAVLPKPGTQRQFEALAARLHSRLMDRSRPLWEFYVIEGLSDGTIGFFAKVHHAAIDGHAGVALSNAMLDLSPEPRTVKRPRARRRQRDPANVAELLNATLSNTLRQAGMLGQLLRPLGQALIERARESLGGREFDLETLLSLLKMPPPTPFNVSITNQRVFAALTLPLDRAKRLGKAHGASINDLVLWLCSTALRDYLGKSQQLPEASLVAGVPVSLRAEGDTRMNNQVAMSFVELATQEPDPLRRLELIRQATASMKNTKGSLGSLIPTDFPSLGAPWLLSGLVSLYTRSGLADRLRVANVAISNVPGSPLPLYLAGAKMLDYYPVSIAAHGVALNITVMSYMGQLCFGLIACRRAVPGVRDIAAQMQLAFDAFSQLAPPETAVAPVVAAVAAVEAPQPRRPAAGKKAAKTTGKSSPQLHVVPKPPVRARAARPAKARA